MPREKECYRDNLERLSEEYPDREALSPVEVAQHLGMKRDTAIRVVPFKKVGGRYYIPIVNFARWLS